MSDETLLNFDQVSKSFPNSGQVLDQVSFTLAPGETMAITGPSGCGKSTLLNLAGTLDLPDSGTIQINGKDTAALSDQEAAALRNQTIGFIFQEHHLLPQCNVLENVLMPGMVKGASSEMEARGRELLTRIGLGERLQHRPAQLSGGQRQRVAVVRALINQPQLLLADEPTGSLDQDTALELMAMLVELQADLNFAIILVTHDESISKQMQTVKKLIKGRFQ